MAKVVSRAKQMAAFAKATRSALSRDDCKTALTAYSHYNYARGAYNEGKSDIRTNWQLTTGVMLNMQRDIVACFKKRKG